MAHQYAHADLQHSQAGDLIDLTGAEAKHAATVSRVRIGERLRVSDGRGVIAAGPVEAATPSQVSIRIDAIERVPAAEPALWLVQALAKGDRDELAIQAATELGVDRVLPWAASRSVSRWDNAKAVKGRARWQSIVDEAAKQSLRAWTPIVAEPQRLRDLEQLAHQPGTRVLVCAPNGPLALADLEFDARTIVLVVGPEGGMERDEIAALAAAGADVVRMGAEVLRTSTAGPAALAVIASRIGRWA